MPLPTTFPVEQAKPGSPFKSELDLPRCSVNQAVALTAIRYDGKGSYKRYSNGDWLPEGGDMKSKEWRQVFRATDRTILSLIRNGYLQVAQELNGRPVRVTLTFP